MSRQPAARTAPPPGMSQPAPGRFVKPPAATLQRKARQSGAWLEVIDKDDGAVYYYNRVTRVSQWEKPPEMKTVYDWAEAVDIGNSDWQQILFPGRPIYFYHKPSGRSTWVLPPALAPVLVAQETARLAAADEQRRQAELEEQRKEHEIAVQFTADAVVPRVAQGDAWAGTAFGAGGAAAQRSSSSSSVDNPWLYTYTAPDSSDDDDETSSDLSSDDDDSVDPLLRAIADFKQMLREHDVAPFAQWDAELPKFLDDARFKAIGKMAQRRLVFDEFVAHRDAELREEKLRQLKAASERVKAAFAADAFGLTARTAYADACRQLSEAARADAELGAAWALLNDAAREAAFRAVSAPLRAAREREKAAVRDAFVALLRDSDVGADASWSRTKAALRKEPRYANGVLRSEEREQLFRDYVAALRESAPVDRAAREREVTQRLEEERRRVAREREADLRRARQQHADTDAETAFRVLLQERDTLRQPASLEQLAASDARGRALSAEHRAALLHEHRADLRARSRTAAEHAVRARLAVRDGGLAGINTPADSDDEAGAFTRNGRDWAPLRAELAKDERVTTLPDAMLLDVFEAVAAEQEQRLAREFDALLTQFGQQLTTTPPPPHSSNEDRIQFNGMVRMLKMDKRWIEYSTVRNEAALTQLVVDKIAALQKQKTLYDTVHEIKRPLRDNVAEPTLPDTEPEHWITK